MKPLNPRNPKCTGAVGNNVWEMNSRQDVLSGPVEVLDSRNAKHVAAVVRHSGVPNTVCVILDAYDRQIKSPADIVDHLDFTETNPDPDPWGEHKELVELISRFVVHYLTGTGHPHDSDQVIHALIGDNGSVADSILRATLFLSVLAGSTMLPVRPSWKIKCLITHDWSELYPTTNAAGREDFGPEIMVEFRSCFKTFTVTNNTRLRCLLLSQRLEELPEGQDSHFGQFIHAGLVASRASYHGDIQIGNPSLSMEDLTSIFTFPPPIIDPSANPFFDPAYDQFFDKAQHLIQS
ncbi:hypothetical protein B0H16DRAFT_1712894 [Mycena metata]|uniref:Uncharacterized protein n=1 Tax=Mycena metata TaxID=1033252 RepID=A0AAD7NU55_9AGAR|nr:hypothetical protein B0H16DRAFT_1712894 [Mycena metata]